MLRRHLVGPTLWAQSSISPLPFSPLIFTWNSYSQRGRGCEGRSVGFGGRQVMASSAWSGVAAAVATATVPSAVTSVTGNLSSPACVTRTFWAQDVAHTAPADLKRRFAFERAADRRSRFHVRSRLREDGVISNLYLVSQEAAEGIGPTPLYVYEMYVTRKAAPALTDGTTTSVTTSGRTKATTAEPVLKRVSPKRSWQAVCRSLVQRFTDLPPMVQLDYHVYTAAPLPAEALQIPAAFHDLGWRSCELRLRGKSSYTDLSPSQLQRLTNKIVPWCVRHRNSEEDTLAVVREHTGKLVFTTRGIASGGLRVFKGVLVQALFVDSSAADSSHNSNSEDAGGGIEASSNGKGGVVCHSSYPQPPAPLEGSPHGLATLPQGIIDVPFRFLVDSFVRTITYKGKKVESYYLADTSGKYLASYWEPMRKPQALEVGKVYVATHARVKDYPNRGNFRLFELTEGVTVVAAEETGEKTEEPAGVGQVDAARKATTTPAATTNRHATSPASRKKSPSGNEETTSGHLPGRLALKIDAKGTIASETSLYEDVKQHFGTGPYDEETQRRIAASVQGTPVVTSFSLRQAIVRMVRFDANAAAQEMAAMVSARDTHTESGGRKPHAHAPRQQQQQQQPSSGGKPRNGEARPALATRHMPNRILDPGLVPLLPHLDANQPWAILTDYTAFPLQVLHCCFDPTMRGWQDIAVSVLSLMPEKRVELLQRFRALLSSGLAAWGLRLAPQPLRTMAVSLLPMPQKDTRKATAYWCSGINDGGGGSLRHPLPSPFPTTLLVVGICGPRATAEEANRISHTVQHLSAYFKTNLAVCVDSEADAVRNMMEKLLSPATGNGGSRQQQQQRLRDPNTAMVIVTADRESRGARWVLAECLCRGVLPLLVGPARSPKMMNLLSSSARRQLLSKFETNPLKGVDIGRNIPVLAHQRVLVVGVDSCHTNVVSTGAVVGILYTPERNHLLPIFWRHEARGRETQHVADHFRVILARAIALYEGLDQVVVFQDGDVFSELNAMKTDILATVPTCGLTFMCLHKRTNIRFVHKTGHGSSRGVTASAGNNPRAHNNLVKGSVIPALTPVPLDVELAAPSFYLQTHESNMSTARTVEYTVHHVSPTLDIADVQQLANVMANVMAPQSTKLPMSTRCAHKLADKAERLLDAVPEMTCAAIPAPLNERLWFL